MGCIRYAVVYPGIYVCYSLDTWNIQRRIPGKSYYGTGCYFGDYVAGWLYPDDVDVFQWRSSGKTDFLLVFTVYNRFCLLYNGTPAGIEVDQ